MRMKAFLTSPSRACTWIGSRTRDAGVAFVTGATLSDTWSLACAAAGGCQPGPVGSATNAVNANARPARCDRPTLACDALTRCQAGARRSRLGTAAPFGQSNTLMPPQLPAGLDGRQNVGPSTVFAVCSSPGTA